MVQWPPLEEVRWCLSWYASLGTYSASIGTDGLYWYRSASVLLRVGLGYLDVRLDCPFYFPRAVGICRLCQAEMYTNKKENEIFRIYNEIQMGSVAMSYIMRKGLLIYEEMCKYLTILRRPLVLSDFATDPF